MRLGGEERIENTAYNFLPDARSGICYRDPHAGRHGRGLYVQNSFPIGHGTHRLDSIHDQVSEDQLQLDSVAQDVGKIAEQFGPNGDLFVLNLSARQP